MKRKYFIFLLVVVLLFALPAVPVEQAILLTTAITSETDCQYSLSNQGFAAFLRNLPTDIILCLQSKKIIICFLLTRLRCRLFHSVENPTVSTLKRQIQIKRAFATRVLCHLGLRGTVYFYNENLYVPTTSISNNKTLYPILEVSPDGAGRKCSGSWTLPQWRQSGFSQRIYVFGGKRL